MVGDRIDLLRGSGGEKVKSTTGLVVISSDQGCN